MLNFLLYGVYALSFLPRQDYATYNKKRNALFIRELYVIYRHKPDMRRYLATKQ